MIGERPTIDPRGRYSAAQAGELLGVDKATVNRWARKGLLPRRISKINGRIRYIGATSNATATRYGQRPCIAIGMAKS